MTDLVNSTEISAIVGVPRQQSAHMARAVSAEGKVYILHSESCLKYGKDLRECRYSKALDRGIDQKTWTGWQDKPVQLCVVKGELLPIRARRAQTGKQQ